MRPYQLYPNGPWVDLDSVQVVTPPVFVDRMGSGGYYAVMDIRFAFQNEPMTIRWGSDCQWKEPNQPNKERDRLVPVLIEGVPEALHRMELTVYRPLMGWWGEVGIKGPVEPRGYDAAMY